MNNEKSFLYDLCERTHTSRTLEKTIEDINAHLQKIAWRGRSTANITLHDTDEYKDAVYFSPIFPSTIIVNITNIKLPLNVIYDFIVAYFQDHEIEVDSDTECGYLELSLSWENKIQEYLDSQTKADDNSLPIMENMCSTIETFIDDCETNVISLWFTFSENMTGGYDIDANAYNKLFHLTIPKTEAYYDIAENICNYFKNNKKYDINVDTNAATKVGTASYILVKLQSSEDIEEDQKIDSCITADDVVEEIEFFITKCIGGGNSEYIYLVVKFCDLNLEDSVFEYNLDTCTFILKLPNNDNGHCFHFNIYNYFVKGNKYTLQSRPIINLSENLRYEIRQNDEYEEYIKAQLDASCTSCSDQVGNTKTTDTVTATGIYTDTKRGNIIISNDKNRIEWDKISDCLNYHLNEQSEEYMYIQIQSGSYETLKHPIRIEDNIWRLPIQLLDIDSPEVMAGYVCDFCIESGYDIRLVATAYNNVGVTGYMIYRVSKKK